MALKLDPQKIVESARLLHRRIAERLPDSGLSHVAAECERVAEDGARTVKELYRPSLGLRASVAVLIAGIIGIVIALLTDNKIATRFTDYSTFVETLEATLASMVYIGLAIVFLVSLEARLRRGRITEALQDLRGLAHIVDMHQLTKTPARLEDQEATASSPKLAYDRANLTRYLHYCTELLDLITKIGAVYVRETRDPVAHQGVDDLQDLNANLTHKIWQKLTILRLTSNPAA